MNTLDKLNNYLPKIYKKKEDTDRLLYIVLYCISRFFDEDMEDDFSKIIACASLITAEGFWLDFWGYFFHIKRFVKEEDIDYKRRILLSIKLGSVSRNAIIQHVSQFSRTEPILEEHNGEVLNNQDYSSYSVSDLYKKFTMTITYYPFYISQSSKLFFIGTSYIGYDSYLTVSEKRYSYQQIKAIIDNLKAAGIKLIHKVLS